LETAEPSTIGVTDIFTARAGSHLRTGVRTTEIEKKNGPGTEPKVFWFAIYSGRALLRECSLGAASIPMGVWHSEDCSRETQRKNGNGKECRQLINMKKSENFLKRAFLLDRCPLNGCRCL
jgi:hypothetical protein